MNALLQIIKQQLLKIVDNIDAGNSNLTENEQSELLESLTKITEKDKPLTKYESAKFLHISRATFDNLVKDGLIPNGQKLYQGDSNIFWYKKDLNEYKQNKLKSYGKEYNN